MSDTTIFNSRAVQALLAQASRDPDQTPPSSGATASFHQVLEGELSERTKSVATSAGLTAATAPPSVGGSTLKFARALANAGPTTRRPDTVKELPTRAAKAAAPSTGGKTSPGTPPRAVRPANAAGKIDDPSAADATEGAANLDVEQIKVANAPGLPEQPPAMARAAPAPTQARGQAEGALKPASTSVSPQEGASATTAIGGGSRGFAAVLASARASASAPTSLIDQASLDPTLHMTVTPQAAHLSLDAGAAGPLTAQLQITNGVADVHLTGEAATVLARHGAELSLGLTAAGLQPGRVEITPPTSASETRSATSQGGGSAGSQTDGGEEPGSKPQDQMPRDPKQGPTLASTLSRRTSQVHVKA